MPLTRYLQISYPVENADPFFDEIEESFNELDSQFFGLLAGAGPVLGGGSIQIQTITVSPATALMTWTAPFEAFIPGSGFYYRCPFGPDLATMQLTLVDGDRVCMQVPVDSGDNVVGNIFTINGPVSPNRFPGLLTLGFYRSGQFYSGLPKITQVVTNAGNVAIPVGQDSLSVTYPASFGASPYVLEISYNNLVDPYPMFQPHMITAKTGPGFTISWPAAWDSANYSLDYKATQL